MSKKNINALSLRSLKENLKLLNFYNNFRSQLNKTIKKKPFLVAVSGGPDSLALTALSQIYKLEKKVKVSFVLIDHGLRKNSKKEAFYVRKLLNKQKIKLHIIKNNKIINKNIQSEARKVRYELLKNFCIKKKISYILTGHHSDDQIETFLIRLSRGSGIQGLSSMNRTTKINRKIKIFRPLLNSKKKDLMYIAKTIFKKTIKDPSNSNKKYLRTNIRSLVSHMERSGIHSEQILRSINNLASSKQILERYLKNISKDCLKKKKNEFILNLKILLSEPEEIKLKILSSAIKEFSKSYYPPRSKKVINALSQIKSKNKAKLTLGGCILQRSGNNLSLKAEVRKKH
tara:strand:- start:455 stop:1486 length:1032 start_codon:yes stop_codon:yes gene_type:complete